MHYSNCHPVNYPQLTLSTFIANYLFTITPSIVLPAVRPNRDENHDVLQGLCVFTSIYPFPCDLRIRRFRANQCGHPTSNLNCWLKCYLVHFIYPFLMRWMPLNLDPASVQRVPRLKTYRPIAIVRQKLKSLQRACDHRDSSSVRVTSQH